MCSYILLGREGKRHDSDCYKYDIVHFSHVQLDALALSRPPKHLSDSSVSFFAQPTKSLDKCPELRFAIDN